MHSPHGFEIRRFDSWLSASNWFLLGADWLQRIPASNESSAVAGGETVTARLEELKPYAQVMAGMIGRYMSLSRVVGGLPS